MRPLSIAGQPHHLLVCQAFSHRLHIMSSNANSILRGVVFDMDGTCTKACIDFQEMRRRSGILTGDLLAVLDSWPEDKRVIGNRAIEEVEAEALPKMQLMPGLLSLCQWLDQQQIPRGLITRNSMASVDYFHGTHFTEQPFLPALCRDFRPYKPSPEALLHICREWGIPPHECLMVGDSAPDDVVSGNRAGALTCLLDTEGVYTTAELEGEKKPSLTVKSLDELQSLLQTRFQILPPRLS